MAYKNSKGERIYMDKDVLMLSEKKKVSMSYGIDKASKVVETVGLREFYKTAKGEWYPDAKKGMSFSSEDLGDIISFLILGAPTEVIIDLFDSLGIEEEIDEILKKLRATLSLERKNADLIKENPSEELNFSGSIDLKNEKFDHDFEEDADIINELFAKLGEEED